MPLCETAANWLATPRALAQQKGQIAAASNVPIFNPILERELDVDDFTMMIAPHRYFYLLLDPRFNLRVAGIAAY
jgi:hypothetical protein